MRIPGRPLLMAAVVAALAALAVVHPTVSVAHALEHLDPTRAMAPAQEDPQGDQDSEAYCDLCVSLSRGRVALVSTLLLAEGHTSLVGRTEPLAPPLLPVCLSRPPESPRAPPFG